MVPLASIPITLSGMRLDSNFLSPSEASQLGLPCLGSLTHPWEPKQLPAQALMPFSHSFPAYLPSFSYLIS